MNKNKQIWAEDLPDNCPPEDAKSPKGEVYYRLVKYNPPKESDFFSQRKLNPEKKFNVKISECRAKSLSISSSMDRAKKALKLPIFRRYSIAEIKLSIGSGVVKQTKSDALFGKFHYSWWKYKNFNPIPLCKVVV